MSKEVMKQALEALEKLVRFESDSWEIGSCRIAGQATKALREALAEQPAQPQKVRLWDTQWTNVVNHDNAYKDWDKQDAINHAVKMTEQYIAKNVHENKCPPAAQPQQQPVAWTVAGQVRDWSKDFSAYQTKHYVRPVYTSPLAQRKPLTYEQRNTIIGQECRYTSEAATEDHHRLIEAVELLHNIKENT